MGQEITDIIILAFYAVSAAVILYILLDDNNRLL